MYKEIIHTDMTFGEAIECMQEGGLVARQGWNGKDMYLAIQKGSVIDSSLARGGIANALKEYEKVETITILPHIDMRAANGSIVVGWLASQTDMQALDWMEIIPSERGESK